MGAREMKQVIEKEVFDFPLSHSKDSRTCLPQILKECTGFQSSQISQNSAGIPHLLIAELSSP